MMWGKRRRWRAQTGSEFTGLVSETNGNRESKIPDVGGLGWAAVRGVGGGMVG